MDGWIVDVEGGLYGCGTGLYIGSEAWKSLVGLGVRVLGWVGCGVAGEFEA
jgi:hypothetical protein